MKIRKTARPLGIPLAKSPWPKGRIGPKERQDWYIALSKAVSVSRTMNAGILIISGVFVKGVLPEFQYYRDELVKMGLTRIVDYDWGKLGKDRFIELYENQETVGQIEGAAEVCWKRDFYPIFVSTWLHYPRVRWLTRSGTFYFEAEHHAVFGIPRPREAITDIILMVLFPLIDWFGLRTWFQEKVIARRKTGRY